MDSPSPEVTKLQQEKPTVVQIDPKCLHSALKEFIEPLRTNDPRTDFFAIYRRESEEFDRDYAKKYDEDLNTSLIFAGLFSAVSSAFIIDVQSKLEPDSNEMTAAYMQILIHTMNNSLFPDANPDSIIWTGPPPEIVTVQSLLYASLATSLFAAFLAMLGKQWVNRYLRNHRGSAADKSRDRQRKVDGFKKWHFQLAIESLPVMLQFALLLFGCALSRYLWTISRTVAGVIIAITLFGVTSYVFFTLAATLYYNCPYQTPPSILARTVTRYLAHSDAAFARSLRALIGSLPSIKHPGWILGRLRRGVRSVLRSFRCVPAIGEEAEHIPLAVVVTPPTRVFKDISINWEVCKADVRCISWILDSTTDIDVIFSTVRFAADMVWYPEIATALSPHTLADLFFDCLLDGRVVPGKSEHASSIGMALASVLSIRLSTEPEDEGLRELCERLLSQVQFQFPFDRKFQLVVAVLRLVARVPTPDGSSMDWEFTEILPNGLSPAHKLWLSRVILQTIWRRRCVQGPTGVLNTSVVRSTSRTFAADDDQMLDTLKTNIFLALAISLGLAVDFRDLYAPNNDDALKIAIHLFDQQLQLCIVEGKANHRDLTSVLYTLNHLDPFQVTGSGELGFLWITEILNSGYEEHEREGLARIAMELLGKHFFGKNPAYFIKVEPAWIPPLLGFLSLSEKLDGIRSTRFIALRILAASQGSADFGPMILPILTPLLLPTHPLQLRHLALNVSGEFMSGWFSSQMEDVPSKDLGGFIQAIGDPFQFPDLPLQDGKPVRPPGYDPMVAVAVLIEFASLDLWRNHLRHSNFTSFEEMASTWDGKGAALGRMLRMVTLFLPEFLSTATRIAMAIGRLEELRCSNTAEVVIMWAWTVGVVNPVDHDGWQLIGRNTLRFYQTHGMERLIALGRHVADTVMEADLLAFSPIRRLIRRHEESKVEGFIGLPVSKLLPETVSKDLAYLRLSQACQLRRLYHLFGYDPVTWRETVRVEVDKETSVSSGHSVALAPFVDWACDYP